MNFISIKSYLCVFFVSAIPAIVAAEHDASFDNSSHGTNKTLSTYAYDLIKPVPAQPYWTLQASVYTKHFKPNSDHNNNQDLIGLERHTENSYLLGGATFRNSYSQRSYYGYVGKRYQFSGTPFYSKLTAGLLYGYKGEYRDKIPLNRFKVAPAIIPSLGVKYRRVGAEVLLLGTAATMININFEL